MQWEFRRDPNIRRIVLCDCFAGYTEVGCRTGSLVRKNFRCWETAAEATFQMYFFFFVHVYCRKISAKEAGDWRSCVEDPVVRGLGGHLLYLLVRR